ncbi:MAG: DUF2314 domain-containing protein [Desulfomonile tiedjei]|nr:DUF2314 domain-containing protein [Desulfomonile tiedjei]
MIQVRCPECGYLQTLSEERFLSIPENFLNCPHCHARVPKEWTPSTTEAVPEEAHHKMLAFSRRILNGREVGRDMVLALESLVHRYGPLEQAAKALAIGYAGLGDKKKAEEFLAQARKESPDDPEILRCLLDILLADQRFEEAVQVGGSLVQAQQPRAEDEDIAGLALALLGAGNAREAKTLMDSHPGLDSRNPVVKQARKQLVRGARGRFSRLLHGMNPLSRLLEAAGKEKLKTLSGKARSLIKTAPGQGIAGRGRSASPRTSTAEKGGSVAPPRPDRLPVVLEYWVYAPAGDIPKWEDVRDRLADLHARTMERERTLKLVESLIAGNDLTLEYILREEAKDIFDYPDEVIPRNAREMGSGDLQRLRDAQMIVRLRLSLKRFSGTDYLAFMVRFVEAVRSLTHGVVQDAISHILWGTPEWQAHTERPADKLIQSHVQLEIIDEGETVWIHSHGMQKFGLPDLEMENIPPDLASAGKDLLIMVAESLVSRRDRGLDFRAKMNIPATPFSFAMESRPKDEEGHFPAGSLKILPHMPDYDLQRPDAAKHVLKMFCSAYRSHVTAGRRSEAPGPEKKPLQPVDPKIAALKEQYLAAHKKALSELPVFKKSFQTKKDADGNVHAVKVGFPAPGGAYEWMWVSLESWRGDSIEGHLENAPVLRKDLQQGSMIRISEPEIFDWVISRSGHVMKGAFTEQLASP